MAPSSLAVPPGEEKRITDANQRVKNVKTRMVKDGKTFPALQDITKSMAQPDPALGQVYKDLAKANAKAKIAEIHELLN